MHLGFNQTVTASECALFLDFDGTLVDIAATPDAISITQDLVPLLERLNKALEGRVCIVTGRPLEAIRHYLAPLDLDIVSEHGNVLALRGTETIENLPWPESWNEHLLTLDHCIPKLVVEKKATSVALHYRQQPELEAEVVQFAALLQKNGPRDFVVVTSNFTTEIRRANVDKGTAIAAVMSTPRYKDKTPVFIADDDTDIPGFHAVEKLGGLALKVRDHFNNKTENVRMWLDGLTRLRSAA
jgi:trehalose 6-phosphate phosphatase